MGVFFFLKRIGVRELACWTGSIKTGKNDRHLEIIFEKFMEEFSKALHIFSKQFVFVLKFNYTGLYVARLIIIYLKHSVYKER